MVLNVAIYTFMLSGRKTSRRYWLKLGHRCDQCVYLTSVSSTSRVRLPLTDQLTKHMYNWYSINRTSTGGWHACCTCWHLMIKTHVKMTNYKRYSYSQPGVEMRAVRDKSFILHQPGVEVKDEYPFHYHMKITPIITIGTAFPNQGLKWELWETNHSSDTHQG